MNSTSGLTNITKLLYPQATNPISFPSISRTRKSSPLKYSWPEEIFCCKSLLILYDEVETQSKKKGYKETWLLHQGQHYSALFKKLSNKNFVTLLEISNHIEFISFHLGVNSNFFGCLLLVSGNLLLHFDISFHKYVVIPATS